MLEMLDAVKSYRRGDQVVNALAGVTLQVGSGEFVSIMGASGSGKSTLLHLLGGLDVPTSGQVKFAGQPLHAMTDDELSDHRLNRVGFIFQFFNLIPTLSAWENVALPLFLARQKPELAKRRALEGLALVGLEDRAHHRPHQMSGGQMQRVAVARALVGNPKVLLADEPTGNLDSATGRGMLEMLQGFQTRMGLTIVMVTHDDTAARYGTRLVQMRDGKVVSDEEVTDRNDRLA